MAPKKKKRKTKKKKTKKKKSPQKSTALTLRDIELPVRADASPRSNEALEAYFQSVRRYSLLSPEREFEVAERYFKNHEPEAAQILILANLRLVVKIANSYLQTGFHVLDLIQEGNTGLLQAVKEYDPYRGVKFSSYASYWIKAYIRSFILKNWSLVKMGTTRAQRTLFYRLQKEKKELEAMGIVPETRQLAEKFDVREKDVVEMSQRLSGRDVSLDSTPAGPSDSREEGLLRFMRDESASVDDQIAAQEIQSEFHERLDTFERTLAGKELLIFRERLRAEKPKTLQEIGNIYGITRERVRQIEARVLEKLKDYMKKNAKFMENIIDV